MEFMCVCIKGIVRCILIICSAFYWRIVQNILADKNTVTTEIINYYSGLNVVDKYIELNTITHVLYCIGFRKHAAG